MGILFSYSLYSSILLSLLYLSYKWVLAGENQHAYNRTALWLICLVALLGLPLSRLAASIGADAPAAVMPEIEMGQIQIGLEADESAGFQPLWLTAVLWIYLSGVVLTAVQTLLIASRLWRIISAGETVREGRYKIILTDDRSIAPFSWWRYVVMSRSDWNESGRMILTHELQHLSLHHWIDLAVAQIISIFQWYNPSAWLMREEFKTVHEYQADKAVLESGIPARDYQMLLIKKAVGARFPSLANSLNHSKLKKRITMMYQSKSKASGRLRALALVPAFAVAAAVINLPAVASVIADASDAQVSYSDSKVKDDARQIKIVDYVKVVGSSGNVADGSSEASSSLDSMKIYVNGQRVLPQELNEMSPDVIASIDVDKSKSTIHVILKKSGDDGNADIRMTGKPVSVIAVKSEKKDDGSEMKTKSTNIEVSSEPVTAVEVMPRYPGGEAEMMKFLAMNLRYPEAAMKSGKSGRVVVRFVVSKTGKVENPEIMRGISPELDAEALRVVGTLPDFIPGQSDGKPVACHYALPISFSLTGGDEKAANQGAANK